MVHMACFLEKSIWTTGKERALLYISLGYESVSRPVMLLQLKVNDTFPHKRWQILPGISTCRLHEAGEVL